VGASSSSQARAEGGADVDRSSDYYEQWFIAELPTIGAITSFIARRHRLSADEAEELLSLVHVKLIDDDYAILRKFEGRSSLRTYLTIVIRRILLDSRASMWGKWRPSAQAKREGEVATLLDRLTTRQGLSFDQACTLLETVHGIEVDRTALAETFERLPTRASRHVVGEEALAKIPCASTSAEDFVAARSRRRVARQASQILAAELAMLSPDDQRILQLRFVDGLTVGSIAERMTTTAPSDIKALYRHLRQVLDALRARLEARGLQRAEVLDLIGVDEVTVPRVLALPPGGGRRNVAPEKDIRVAARRRSG
jgi:RNA polymerase sigma factor (sigma-70 family)